ncbi:nucleosomal histone kinase 1 isoform X2 [Chironomus tepperi]|uniref:nucleosomal histone kinase 1 isoform X2 n=1 Tax=Chironomus tepperi TaxID=113505 RepID=UPI00391FA3FA
MASKDKPVAKKASKKKNAYEQPKHLKTGSIIVDNYKKQWKIGVSIGMGGFGEIYSACDASSGTKKVDDYPYVVKIEPHTNGPLFVEMHFYMRNAKKDDIDKFAKDNKIKSLGMPIFIGSGSHEIESIKHRFLVMPRYGKDIWKIFLEQNRKFPLHTVYRLGLQLINVLEYIHQREYVHMDIKGTNILLGFGSNDHVFLLDFGLACHYSTKEYKVDPKKAHNGTIEYTSRDAHNGVPTMRGDIEILAYNLIEWAGAKLPWTTSNQILQKPVEVQKLKESFMKDTEKSLKSAFGSIPVPSQLTAFMKYVESMKHNDVPDYKKIRSIFESGLKELKQSNSGKLDFVSKSKDNEKAAKSPIKRAPTKELEKAAKSPVKRAHTLTKDPAEKAPKQPKVLASATTESTDDDRPLRSKRINDRKRYAELNSDDEVEATVTKKTDKKKEEKSKPTPEKSENKTDNKSPRQKKAKDDKNEKVAAGAKGKVILKSSAGSTKKTKRQKEK